MGILGIESSTLPSKQPSDPAHQLDQRSCNGIGCSCDRYTVVHRRSSEFGSFFSDAIGSAKFAVCWIVIQIERGAKMTEDISLEFSLFVERGREREAANFYAAAFGAQEENTSDIDGVLAAVEMRFGNLPVWVAGSNPNREKSPSYGGPFFPKEPGAVSTMFHLNVGNIEDVMQRALAAGAVVRDEIQTDIIGRRVASIFDPFGHIWALAERKAEGMSLAA
ncbi:VOC family protein [Agrobacterium tumefaciens]|uniref:VOC family protein n=1 Tax=Agrobacterium tumefaciens TaxID=358 RepID=UPI001FFD993D|nr:VOC family protein [Agrobacterium tumefaciens]